MWVIAFHALLRTEAPEIMVWGVVSFRTLSRTESSGNGGGRDICVAVPSVEFSREREAASRRTVPLLSHGSFLLAVSHKATL